MKRDDGSYHGILDYSFDGWLISHIKSILATIIRLLCVLEIFKQLLTEKYHGRTIQRGTTCASGND